MKYLSSAILLMTLLVTGKSFAGDIESINYDQKTDQVNVVVNLRCKNLTLTPANFCQKSMPGQTEVKLTYTDKKLGEFCPYSMFDVVSIPASALDCSAPFYVKVTADDGSYDGVLVSAPTYQGN